MAPGLTCGAAGRAGQGGVGRAERGRAVGDEGWEGGDAGTGRWVRSPPPPRPGAQRLPSACLAPPGRAACPPPPAAAHLADQLLADGADELVGRAHDQHVGVRRRRHQVWHRQHVGPQRHAGQVLWVLVRRVDGVRQPAALRMRARRVCSAGCWWVGRAGCWCWWGCAGLEERAGLCCAVCGSPAGAALQAAAGPMHAPIPPAGRVPATLLVLRAAGRRPAPPAWPPAPRQPAPALPPPTHPPPTPPRTPTS